MSKFLVLFMAPAEGLEEWMKIDESVRKVEEEKMKAEWDIWMKENGSGFKEMAGAGKTMRVTKGASEDTKNDIMLYALVEGESREAVSKLLETHPHLGIPGAWIEVMPANVLPGMSM